MIPGIDDSQPGTFLVVKLDGQTRVRFLTAIDGGLNFSAGDVGYVADDEAARLIEAGIAEPAANQGGMLWLPVDPSIVAAADPTITETLYVTIPDTRP